MSSTATTAQSTVPENEPSTRFRYPGETVTREKVRQAIATVTPVRQFVRSRLGLV